MKVFLFVMMAAILEAIGDAILRLAVHAQSPLARVGFFAIGGLLLTLYGTSLNLAPVEFATVVGLYIAMLFVAFQVANFLFFKILPTVPVLVGGALIITSPYTWLEEYTPRERWLDQGAGTLAALQEKLAPAFTLAHHFDLPMLIRDHRRKYQWTVTEASVWERK